MSGNAGNAGRIGSCARKSAETDVTATVALDGKGVCSASTGVGFLDHMVTLLGRHGSMDIAVGCVGDLHVDHHHSVEDVGIAMGRAISDALGSRESIARYGQASVPMDEALANVAADFGGRAFLVYDVPATGAVGGTDIQLMEEFLRALAFNCGLTLHVSVPYGKNGHHMVEAAFKALGRAFKEAVRLDPGIEGVLSTKGVF